MNVDEEGTAWNVLVAGVLDGDGVRTGDGRTVGELVAGRRLDTVEMDLGRTVDSDRQCTGPGLARVHHELAFFTCTTIIRTRLSRGQAIGASLQKIWKRHSIPISTKTRLMKALVWPVVTYGCESWTLRKNEETRLEHKTWT